MRVRYQLMKGKLGESASKSPSAHALKEYAEQLRLQIDDFAQRHHRITIHAGTEAVIATIEVTREAHIVPVVVAQKWNPTARDILRAVGEQHSQWAYIQRSVHIFEGPRVHIVKAARLLDWTRTQAVQDAANLVSEILDRNSTRYERATA